jgi:hypothetical protein
VYRTGTQQQSRINIRMCESTGLPESDWYRLYSGVILKGRQVETESEQYRIGYRLSVFCRGSKEGFLGAPIGQDW